MNTRSFMPASRGQLAKYRSEISVVGGERERWEGGGICSLQWKKELWWFGLEW